MRGILKEILITINENTHFFSMASPGGVNPAITAGSYKSGSHWLHGSQQLLHTRHTPPPPDLSTSKAHLHLQLTVAISLTPAQIPSPPLAPASVSPRSPSPVIEKSQAVTSPSCPCQGRSNPFPCCCGALLCQNPKLKDRILSFHVIPPEVRFGDNQQKKLCLANIEKY